MEIIGKEQLSVWIESQLKNKKHLRPICEDVVFNHSNIDGSIRNVDSCYSELKRLFENSDSTYKVILDNSKGNNQVLAILGGYKENGAISGYEYDHDGTTITAKFSSKDDYNTIVSKMQEFIIKDIGECVYEKAPKPVFEGLDSKIEIASAEELEGNIVGITEQEFFSELVPYFEGGNKITVSIFDNGDKANGVTAQVEFSGDCSCKDAVTEYIQGFYESGDLQHLNEGNYTKFENKIKMLLATIMPNRPVLVAGIIKTIGSNYTAENVKSAVTAIIGDKLTAELYPQIEPKVQTALNENKEQLELSDLTIGDVVDEHDQHTVSRWYVAEVGDGFFMASAKVDGSGELTKIENIKKCKPVQVAKLKINESEANGNGVAAPYEGFPGAASVSMHLTEVPVPQIGPGNLIKGNDYELNGKKLKFKKSGLCEYDLVSPKYYFETEDKTVTSLYQNELTGMVSLAAGEKSAPKLNESKEYDNVKDKNWIAIYDYQKKNNFSRDTVTIKMPSVGELIVKLDGNSFGKLKETGKAWEPSGLEWYQSDKSGNTYKTYNELVAKEILAGRITKAGSPKSIEEKKEVWEIELKGKYEKQDREVVFEELNNYTYGYIAGDEEETFHIVGVFNNKTGKSSKQKRKIADQATPTIAEIKGAINEAKKINEDVDTVLALKFQSNSDLKDAQKSIIDANIGIGEDDMTKSDGATLEVLCKDAKTEETLRKIIGGLPYESEMINEGRKVIVTADSDEEAGSDEEWKAVNKKRKSLALSLSTKFDQIGEKFDKDSTVKVDQQISLVNFKCSKFSFHVQPVADEDNFPEIVYEYYVKTRVKALAEWAKSTKVVGYTDDYENIVFKTEAQVLSAINKTLNDIKKKTPSNENLNEAEEKSKAQKISVIKEASEEDSKYSAHVEGTLNVDYSKMMNDVKQDEEKFHSEWSKLINALDDSKIEDLYKRACQRLGINESLTFNDLVYKKTYVYKDKSGKYITQYLGPHEEDGALEFTVMGAVGGTKAGAGLNVGEIVRIDRGLVPTTISESKSPFVKIFEASFKKRLDSKNESNDVVSVSEIVSFYKELREGGASKTEAENEISGSYPPGKLTDKIWKEAEPKMKEIDDSLNSNVSEGYLAQDGKSLSKEGYHDAGMFDETKAKQLADKYKGKIKADPSGKYTVTGIKKESLSESVTFWSGGKTNTIADMLDEDFGGEEVYGAQNKELSNLLGVSQDQIIFTTSDDDYENVSLLDSQLNKKAKKVKDGKENITLYKIGDLTFAYNYAEGGLSAIFIKKSDTAKLEKELEKLRSVSEAKGELVNCRDLPEVCEFYKIDDKTMEKMSDILDQNISDKEALKQLTEIPLDPKIAKEVLLWYGAEDLDESSNSEWSVGDKVQFEEDYSDEKTSNIPKGTDGIIEKINGDSLVVGIGFSEVSIPKDGGFIKKVDSTNESFDVNKLDKPLSDYKDFKEFVSDSKVPLNTKKDKLIELVNDDNLSDFMVARHFSHEIEDKNLAKAAIEVALKGNEDVAEFITKIFEAKIKLLENVDPKMIKVGAKLMVDWDGPSKVVIDSIKGFMATIVRLDKSGNKSTNPEDIYVVNINQLAAEDTTDLA